MAVAATSYAVIYGVEHQDEKRSSFIMFMGALSLWGAVQSIQNGPAQALYADSTAAGVVDFSSDATEISALSTDGDAVEMTSRRHDGRAHRRGPRPGGRAPGAGGSRAIQRSET